MEDRYPGRRRSLLRPRREWPTRNSSNERDELATLHLRAPQQALSNA
jgi:hypothetical protein